MFWVSKLNSACTVRLGIKSYGGQFIYVYEIHFDKTGSMPKLRETPVVLFILLVDTLNLKSNGFSRWLFPTMKNCLGQKTQFHLGLLNHILAYGGNTDQSNYSWFCLHNWFLDAFVASAEKAPKLFLWNVHTFVP